MVNNKTKPTLILRLHTQENFGEKKVHTCRIWKKKKITFVNKKCKPTKQHPQFEYPPCSPFTIERIDMINLVNDLSNLVETLFERILKNYVIKKADPLNSTQYNGNSLVSANHFYINIWYCGKQTYKIATKNYKSQQEQNLHSRQQ